MRPLRGGAPWAWAPGLTAALWLAAIASPAGAGDAPQWMRQAAAVTLTAAQTAAPAVVLLDEITTTIDDDGTAKSLRRYVARINTNDGNAAGTVGEVYLTDTGKLRQARGWIIRPSGEVMELGADFVADIALAPNDVYNEARMRLVTSGKAEPGAVFGAEIALEDRSIFAQLEWPLQQRWPVKVVRRTLAVPQGWSVSEATFNHEPIEPVRAGDVRTWQLVDLHGIADEFASPPPSSLVPRLAVGYAPAAPRAGGPKLDGWPAVSRWLAALADPQAVGGPALIEKAKALAGAVASPIERIRAIADFVQKVPYISVQIGLGRGGGYRPRRAAEVFERNHGDCKDKATLMRAMLAAVGIESHPAAVFAGDRTFVRETWPSPHQFNHVILAIVIDDVTPFPSAGVAHPTLGPLLFFDPTDPHTRPGSLPGHEEGSFALVMHMRGSELSRLPDPGAAQHARRRSLEGRLGPDGVFLGEWSIRATGDMAATEREARARLDARSHQGAVTQGLNAVLPGVRLGAVTALDLEEAFEIGASLTVPAFAQSLPNGLVMVTPPFRVLERLPPFPPGPRTLPVLLNGASLSETLKMKAPPALVVDERPEPASLESPFGTYRLDARLEDTTVVVERQLLLNRMTVPASDYGALKKFLDAVRVADTSPIVLKRRQ